MAETEDDNEEIKKSGVFTEQQRKQVRQKLLGLARQREKEVPVEKKEQEEKRSKHNSNIPLLVDQVFHTSFTMEAYPQQLDEVPYLFLFRTYFSPFFVNKTNIHIENLRYLTEVVGMTGTSLQDTINGITLHGEMLRGGPVKFISFCLSKTKVEGHVIIKNIIFYTKKQDP
tara:strand:+ start:1204 stop:1716 length:513 start_codon:yes stop_codon:yes gene_type:complete